MMYVTSRQTERGVVVLFFLLHGFDKIDQGRSGRTGARNVDCGLKVSSMLVRVGDPVNDYFSLDTFAGVVQPSSLK